MDSLLDSESHVDQGSVCLDLHLDLRDHFGVASELAAATSTRIARKLVAQQAQLFEEGPVYLQISPRTTSEVVLNRVALYQMDFGDPRQDGCARMHIHAHGERLLLITTLSQFRIWSFTPIEVLEDLHGIAVFLPEEIDLVSKRTVYGLEIPGDLIISVQIPRGTTHQFIGRAVAISIHPDELSELAHGGMGSGSMESQTSFWGSLRPTSEECQRRSGLSDTAFGVSDSSRVVTVD